MTAWQLKEKLYIHYRYTGELLNHYPYITISVSHAASTQNNISITELSPVIKLSYVVILKPKQLKGSREQKVPQLIIHNNTIRESRLSDDAYPRSHYGMM